MSVDAQAQIVTEESCHGQVIEAVRHNTQMVQECQVQESVSANEQRTAEANLEGPGGGLAGRAAAVSGSLDTARCQVYGAVASDALLGGMGQMVSTAADFFQGMKNPHAFGGATTIDDFIEGRGPKKTTGKKSIITDHFNDLPGRQQGVNDFMSSGVKGVKSTPETVATFSKKRELACSAKMLNEMHAGNAKQCLDKIGAKVAKAAQAGISQELVFGSMGSGPRGYVEQKVAEVETTEDWGSSSA